MIYVVEGFRFYEEFATEAEARDRFEKVKGGFSYCELKAVKRTQAAYYAKSIEIFRK